MMNKREQALFLKLTENRSKITDVFDQPSVRGIWNSVVEKYSDQAHFIYELLQNADDALATSARFILEKDRLLFAHNGKRHFSISDCDREEEDLANQTLGDINAITSIANSNKTEASIGKFGVGFKAVFQYTRTPHIYDPHFQFKIERFIVPMMLDEDAPERRADETLFVFPFDHPERNPAEAYRDISEKLKKLSYPLLFLTHLKAIDFEFGDTIGLYDKSIAETLTFGDTVAERICLTQNAGEDIYDQNLWLFSRLDDAERRYSVGFFMDEMGHLKPVHEPAFCFFPTKESTELNFVVHAPFLLTDSREGIRAGIFHNDQMIALLAKLAADSLEYLRSIGEKSSVRLIDDRIVSIIPIDRSKFSDPEERHKVSFAPFFVAIQKKFRTAGLLPSVGGYVFPENAYWAEVQQLTQLFSNAQLAMIVENENAQWVFPSIGRAETLRNNRALFDYIESLVQTNLNEDVIVNGRSKEYYYNRALGERISLESIRGITSEFIEAQPVEWLHKFYKWLSDTKHRTDMVGKKPIFLDQNGHAAAALDKANQHILFLPVENLMGYTVVHPKLLENSETRSFVNSIGIQQPSLRDQIYNIILPLYKNGTAADGARYFMTFFRYYCKCSNDEVENFIDLIRDYKFLKCEVNGTVQPDRYTAASLYFPTPELKAYFAAKGETRFIALDEYRKLVGPKNEKALISFLTELGVQKRIQIYTRDVDYILSGRNDLPYQKRATKLGSWKEPAIDGCQEILQSIPGNGDPGKSVILWNSLLGIVDEYCTSWKNLDSLLEGTYTYFYYRKKTEPFVSSDAKNLKERAWLMDVNGNFVRPSMLNLKTLSHIYDTQSECARPLMEFLGINMETPSDAEERAEADRNLTETQREKIALADKLEEFGIESMEDLAEFQEYRRLKNSAANAKKNETGGESAQSSQEDWLGEKVENPSSVVPGKKATRQATADVIKDIAQRTKNKPAAPAPSESEEEADADEFMPSAVDYSKKIERAKEKSAAEIDRIAYFEELHERAVQLTQEGKYTAAWFNVLLEMESLNRGEANADSKEISICFAKVEREPGTQRTLVLKHPNRYIPQFMEDLADIPLILHMGDQKKTVAIEVVNIQSYTLRVKIKKGTDIEGIDLSAVTEASIDAKSPSFLLEELRKQFAQLGLADDFNLKDHLCENIEFVFGPPGTGKTTHLARKVLMPMMKQNRACKVLVLTPTNKAADVLVRRIMESSGDDHSYEDWLVRFGGTGDEEIEESPVLKDKTFDIRTRERNVTITTIARFPYDFFMPQGYRVFLYGVNWDYIVIDEASMIPIANIIFPLYKKTPRKFIIAGDPFQIEPITSVEVWKNENIYSMVNLDSFVHPKTEPHEYPVELLTTQYRSVPAVGEIFSQFAYGGILNHHRTEDSQRPLDLGNDLGLETLNVIKYPVSKYESIYRAKRLQHSSSYQVYSALFTFEYVCYLCRAIARTYPGSLYKIGIIAPYRAQADMIDKLLASENLPPETDVQVGTIHGFQGDECDIIFAVFNTPPKISASREMFLNKRNIINVSISRARDYLFIIMPDDNTEGIENLRLVRRVENLIHNTEVWNEFYTADLEELMFGDPKYLENNAFSTSHQSVNVYGLPEKCYEVRTEDNAVDVQIHRTVEKGDRFVN